MSTKTRKPLSLNQKLCLLALACIIVIVIGIVTKHGHLTTVGGVGFFVGLFFLWPHPHRNGNS